MLVREGQNMKMVQRIREAVARLLPSGWSEDMAAGMMAAFAAQAKGF